MKQDWQAQEFRKIVTFGESTTAGAGSTSRGRCWASLLVALINDFQSVPAALVNSGIGASVISPRCPAYPYSGKPAATERVQGDVIEHQPDLLVISYGLNDARGGMPPDIFREELVAIVRQVRMVIDPVIVLVGPHYIWNFSVGGPVWDHGSLGALVDFNNIIASVAAGEGCLYTDVLGAYSHARWMVHCDGVHPNDIGHRIIAHCIFQTLAQHCSCLSNYTRALERTSSRWWIGSAPVRKPQE